MHKNFFLIIAALSFVAYGHAQSVERPELEQDLRKHVEYLASPQLEGRRTGETGATTAAGYVVNQMSRFKLKPGLKLANSKPSYMQPFPYVAGVTLAEGSFLRIISAGSNENRLEPSTHYMPLANSMSGELANIPLVFAGYGITTRDKTYDDLAGIDLNGKAVVVFDGVPSGGSPMQFAGFNIHTKANLAKEHGARALIVIARSDDFRADPLSRLDYIPTFGETALPVVAISRDAASNIFGVKNAADVAEIEKWIAMKTNAPPAIRVSLTKPLTAAISGRIGLTKRVVDAYNVIGIVEGRDPVLKNEAIVIGAHYDHLGRGGRSSLSPDSGEIHHGADDNASGTAAMLELARAFAKEKKNKRTLIFMAFGGEEEGLLGSKHYVNNPVWPLDKTVAMINLDMVGRLNENKLTVAGMGTANEWKEVVESKNLNRLALVKLTHVKPETGGEVGPAFDLQLNQDGFGPSDHSSFYGKKIPVLFFFTGTHTDYHKPSDTADKVNYEGLMRITKYVAAIADLTAQNPNRPTYKVAQTSPTAGRMTFNVSLGTIPSYGDGNDGLTIDGARAGSPADKAGLRAGDKIIKLAGKDIRNISDYMFALGVMKAGETYDVAVKRGNETITMKIIPAPAQPR